MGGRLNYERDCLKRKLALDVQALPYAEAKVKARDERAAIIKGMGKAGQGKRAPLKRINPTSPEGKAIASRYAQPP